MRSSTDLRSANEREFAVLEMNAERHLCECTHPWSKHTEFGCFHCYLCEIYRPVPKAALEGCGYVMRDREGQEYPCGAIQAIHGPGLGKIAAHEFVPPIGEARKT